ncbi:MAG: HAD-IA family hydrolase, partial [Akkermansia sp.]
NPGDHLEKLTGRTFDWDEINALRQKEIVRDLEHAGLLPGAGELIRSLAEKGIPMAVASSSSHRWVDGWLNKLDIMPYFKTVVCRDDNLPVKPDPALFLRAAENLEIQPSQCLVLEDSQNGTTAAFRAGMPVISIPNRVTVQADFSHASVKIGSLKELL